LFTSANDLDVLLMVRDVKLDRLHKYGADLPPELRDIVLRSLRRSPTDRWQHAGDFRDALADWLFANGSRVTPSQGASFLPSLYVGGTPDPGPPRVKRATRAGPPPRAAPRAADLQGELARRALSRARVIRSEPAVPPPPPPDRPAAPS